MAAALLTSLTSLQAAFTWAPYSPSRISSTSLPQQIRLPDLLAALSNASRDFRINALCKVVSEASEHWARETIGCCPSSVRQLGSDGVRDQYSKVGGADTDTHDDGKSKTFDLKTGLLASMCFPTVDRTQLRLCADLLSWIWLLDCHLIRCSKDEARDCVEEVIRLAENEPGSTEINEPGFSKGLQDILKRLERSPESRYTYDRFQRAIHDYLNLLHLGFLHSVPRRSLKSYLACRRVSGWHGLLFILIEYAHGLESLTMEEQRTTALKSLRDTASEAIVYALDIHEYSGPSRLSECNFVPFLAQEQNISSQTAIERAGELCMDRLRAFSTLQADLLRQFAISKADKITSTDRAASIYVRGLGDCIRGILHWVFESERFFGRYGTYVRMSLTVEPASIRNETQQEEIGEAAEE